ncbi:MFS transporter [uncultured Kiloniella sp.]|uniref:MFS transporter n=1 Tax=uncultured Kiloniella sp. TaxID=1133091 RepID=UPI002618A3C2|nr:MFS transporter [uncultured Kiloniella sp.]
MIRQLLPISALLLGAAFLFFAGGINALILPVRGNMEGFSAFSLGLLGTGWAVGYVSACLVMPRFVSKVGHIRAFSVMAAFAAFAILSSLLVVSPFAWIPMRAVSGFCFAGAAMIVESWLGERADASSRGRIFGIYTMVTLAATTTGQMVLPLGDSAGFLFFVLGAMFYCLALVPTAVSSSASPNPLAKVSLDIKGLWKNSPVAVFAVFMVGISNASFGTLAAVYADRIGLVLTSVALFTSIPILTGALVQVPVGHFSDKMDRRKVLLVIALTAIAVDLSFILIAPETQLFNMILIGFFGASIFSMYPVIVAHANDHASEGSFIQVSGGLLLVFGLGSIVGPLLSGFGMAHIGTSGLFMTSLGAHVLIVLYTIWRITRRAPVATDDKVAYVATPPARTSTPETAAMQVEDD